MSKEMNTWKRKKKYHEFETGPHAGKIWLDTPSDTMELYVNREDSSQYFFQKKKKRD